MFNYEIIGQSVIEKGLTVLYSNNEGITVGRHVSYDPSEAKDITHARIMQAAPLELLSATLEPHTLIGETAAFTAADITTAIDMLTPPETKAQLLDRIARTRKAQEGRGVIINGALFYTDDGSLIRLLGATLQAVITPEYTLTWKTADGAVQLDANALITISSMIRSYTQACFDREQEIIAKVEAGSFVETDLEERWPSTVLN